MKVNSPGKKAFLKMLGTLIVAAVGFSGSAMAAPGTTVNVNFALRGEVVRSDMHPELRELKCLWLAAGFGKCSSQSSAFPKFELLG